MLIATAHQLFRLAGTESTSPTEVLRPAGGEIVAVHEACPHSAVALSDGRMVLLGPDPPREIPTGIDQPITSVEVLAQNPPEVLVGTEGAHLYRWAGGEVRRVRAFDELRCRSRWHTPWGGPPAVRTLASAPQKWVYADIHVGSIMRSGDGGLSWEPVTPELDEDVHEVTTCPAAPQRVYANTARAVFVSEDRGRSWEDRGEGLDHRYGRAIAVCPSRPDRLLASVSDGPHGPDVHGQLHISEDAGLTWTHIDHGFPASTTCNINTGHLAWTWEATAWAAYETKLYARRRHDPCWRCLWEADMEIIGLSANPFGE